jgi:aryl-alcohol dehydrogenase-like predicted oxidoreductase
MSKFGYIQGENMELLKKGFIKTPEVVQFAPECYHCIHPDFMRDQLTRSLKRLDTDRIDVYLLHNPEYYLLSNLPLFEEGASTGPDSGAPAVRVQDRTQVKEHQKKLLDRFSATFEALEKEVQSGRIKSYGISSNTFAYDESHPHFVPYEVIQ